jgi:hypothetical protein
MNKFTKIVLTFAVISFIFFRFNNLTERISFDRDHERDAMAVRQILIEKKPVLLGHQADNERGFFMAPYHFYSLAPFYLLGKMNPMNAIKSYVIFHNILFIAMLLCFLKKILGNWQTSIFLLLVAINPLMITYQSTAWNPSVIPTGIILYWYVFYLAYKNNRLKYYIILGIIVGVFTNFHFQFIFQAIPILLLLMQNFRLKEFLKKSVAFGLLFIFTFFPIFIFDLRHDFLNLRLLLNFSSFSSSSPLRAFTFTQYFDPFTNSFLPLVLKQNIFVSLTVYALLLISTIYISRKHRGFLKIFYRGQTLILIFTALIFFLYRGNVSEYYFLFIFLTFFFVLTELLNYIKKPLALLVILMIFLFNFPRVKTLMTIKDGLNLKNKSSIVKAIKDMSGNKKVYVAIDTPVGLNHGFYYLIDYYQINETTSPKAPLFIIHNPPRDNEKMFGAYSLRIPPNL